VILNKCPTFLLVQVCLVPTLILGWRGELVANESFLSVGIW